MPPASHGDPPKHLVIAAALRDAVLQGTYPPGSQLPGENQIMHDHQVQRITARQALAQLIMWGIAEARKGAGTFVRDYKPIIRDGIMRLSGTWGAGLSPWSAETTGRSLAVDQIDVTQTADVPAAIRDLLSIGEEEGAVTRSRRYVLDGKPVLAAVSWIPAVIAAGTPVAQQDTGPGGLYARLAELGHAPVRFREDLRALMPGPEETARLELPAGTPIVMITRTAYDSNGTAVEVNEMTADASAYIFRYEFGSGA